MMRRSRPPEALRKCRARLTAACASLGAQVFNELNARNMEDVNVLKGLLGNRIFLGVIVFTCVVQARAPSPAPPNAPTKCWR